MSGHKSNQISINKKRAVVPEGLTFSDPDPQEEIHFTSWPMDV